jgi:hypothetical protein
VKCGYRRFSAAGDAGIEMAVADRPESLADACVPVAQAVVSE